MRSFFVGMQPWLPAGGRWGLQKLCEDSPERARRRQALKSDVMALARLQASVIPSVLLYIRALTFVQTCPHKSNKQTTHILQDRHAQVQQAEMLNRARLLSASTVVAAHGLRSCKHGAVVPTMLSVSSCRR